MPVSKPSSYILIIIVFIVIMYLISISSVMDIFENAESVNISKLESDIKDLNKMQGL